uniref:Poly(A) RNA polymerase mitochondrial-like central palm domain-containing protein n=1 Tax=Kwoniella dejecticola CBS 10117 TaxID=1296121 RepID=A0A1A6AF95_9TREE|nr:uncharacterized protein I303_00548 [Kwoniella dejecticola CBS 10117]OBR88731.1 hypothetical protein I303_00548 [Kwoniella dejecticola CBS 10117]
MPSPRLSIPPEVLASSGDKLQISIMRMWQSSEPTDRRKVAMEDLRILLSKTINEKFDPALTVNGNEGEGNRFTVDIAGSTSWGGEIGPSTDVDFVILDRNFPRGYEPSVWLQPIGSSIELSIDKIREIRYHPSKNPLLPDCYSLKPLSTCIEGLGMTETERKPYLPIPLLKFFDPIRNLECDLQCNDLTGVYNNSYILAYTKLSPYVLRPMLNTIKNWYRIQSGKANNPKRSIFGLSSYPMCLMCIAYLQHIGHLPNLQQDVRAKVYATEEEWLGDEELVWVEWGSNRGLDAHTTFNKSLPSGWQSSNASLTAAQAVRGFFKYFSPDPAPNRKTPNPKDDKVHFNTSKQIISPLSGGIIPRATRYKDHQQEDDLQSYLRKRNFTQVQIEEIMEEHKKIKFGSGSTGKGDQGIQPDKWVDEMLNHASGIPYYTCNKFFDRISETHKILETLGEEATVQDILKKLA